MVNYEARIENAKKVISEADYILIDAGAGLSTAAGFNIVEKLTIFIIYPLIYKIPIRVYNIFGGWK